MNKLIGAAALVLFIVVSAYALSGVGMPQQRRVVVTPPAPVRVVPVQQGNCSNLIQRGNLSIYTDNLPFSLDLVERVDNYLAATVPNITWVPDISRHIVFTHNYEWAKWLSGYYSRDFAGIFTHGWWDEDDCEYHRGINAVVSIVILTYSPEDVFGTMVHELCHSYGGVHGRSVLNAGETDRGYENLTGPGDCSEWHNFLDGRINIADAAWLDLCPPDDNLCWELRQVIEG